MAKIESPQVTTKVEETYKGLGDPILLEKIDKLFACGVGEHVDLPQLVVVGDQSSGKSSVLEGLMNLPFPRDSGLCTRFATQIIFRRAAVKTITVSIMPSINATPEHAEKVRAWSSTGLSALDAGAFANIMGEVNNVMGLSDQQERTGSNKTTFSTDVLRLEISGPDEEHLSVIDVPGIFKNTTPGLTTKADIDLVRRMVQGYMENPRSVMLTVIPANVDVATQEILELAADADPDGHRTLGVLTKPDLVDEGAEPRVVDLIEGRAHEMRLGWHLVRNLGQKQSSDPSQNRQSVENDFFKNVSPWNRLESGRVGVAALRIRLQDVLATHIRREFPKVRSEIGKKLKAAQAQLRGLGMERETPEKQSAFLLELAMRYQKVVAQALDAKYGGCDFFDDDESIRLATAVTSRNACFETDMSTLGHEYQFCSLEENSEPDGDSQARSPVDPTQNRIVISALECIEVQTRRATDPADLRDILLEQETLSGSSNEGIIQWLTKVYQSSRGFELGTFDSSILATTMKKQTTKWTSLALGYTSDVVAITHNFILKLLALICIDERVTREITATLLDDLVTRYAIALGQVRFLLQVERVGTPMTLNHYFNDNLEKCRQKRTQSLMSQKSFDSSYHGKVVKLEDIVQNHPMSNTEHVVQDIHDILYSYYKVARKRFVDNVCMQAVDHYLINGPETPLTLFSPTFVNGLSPDQLERIAGEDHTTKKLRSQLRKEIKNLETGKGILV